LPSILSAFTAVEYASSFWAPPGEDWVWFWLLPNPVSCDCQKVSPKSPAQFHQQLEPEQGAVIHAVYHCLISNLYTPWSYWRYDPKDEQPCWWQIGYLRFGDFGSWNSNCSRYSTILEAWISYIGHFDRREGRWICSSWWSGHDWRHT